MAEVARMARVLGLAGLLVGFLAAPAVAEEPEPDPVPEQGTTCLLKVVEDADGIKAGLPLLQVRLAKTSDDAGSPVYEGTLLSLPIRVTLWRGMPDEELANTVAEMKSSWDDLEAASLRGATEADGDDALPGEDVETEDNFDQPAILAGSLLETVAYRVQFGPLVEFGTRIAAQDGEAPSNALACLPALVSSLTTVTLDSPLGEFSLPKVDEAETESQASPAVFLGGDSNAMTVPFLTSGSGMPRYMTTASAPATTSVIRYRTFIAEARAQSGACGEFIGDDRGFSSYYEKNHRTRVSVFYDWPGRRITSTKHIGETHRTDWGPTPPFTDKKARASADGIKLYNAGMDSTPRGATYGRVQVNHAVGNPLCKPAGPISYSLIFEAWKNGAARLSGTRRKVPNHEAYVYPTSGAYGNTILKRSRAYFACLNTNCGDESVWATSQ